MIDRDTVTICISYISNIQTLLLLRKVNKLIKKYVYKHTKIHIGIKSDSEYQNLKNIFKSIKTQKVKQFPTTGVMYDNNIFIGINSDCPVNRRHIVEKSDSCNYCKICNIIYKNGCNLIDDIYHSKIVYKFKYNKRIYIGSPIISSFKDFKNIKRYKLYYICSCFNKKCKYSIIHHKSLYESVLQKVITDRYKKVIKQLYENNLKKTDPDAYMSYKVAQNIGRMIIGLEGLSYST